MKPIRHPEWLEPEPTGLTLLFGPTPLDLYRLDGLLWVTKDAVARALGGPVTRSGHWYTRNLTPWSTRIAWMPTSAGAWGSVRLLSLYGAQALARASTSPAAAAFVEWAEAHLTAADAPAGLRSWA